jgi:hypothetical protein
MTLAYVYKWTHLPTGKWYIGSRTRKNCHPNDGYICSSKTVKPMIEQNPNEWARTIIHIGDAHAMRQLETKLLVELNAESNPNSFNKSNNGVPKNPGRKRGHTLKLQGKQILYAIKQVTGKDFMTLLKEHYNIAKQEQDVNTIKIYDIMFAKKGIKL